MSNIIYDIHGAILRIVLAPSDMLEMQVGEGEFLLRDQIGDYHTSYVVDNVVTDRPIQTTVLNKTTLNADGIDSIEFTNVPNAKIFISGKTRETSIVGEISGSDTFSTTIAGTYKVMIQAFPYLDFKTTIEAV
ncbi:hypothetical protein UFOVP1516_88 [uncultured Caudovirales phage]|uniref:Uncharacterized protein n=1 Tax=uncultured Caudovirales phage TaxID=2100421 RepID=A0A6J5PB78_9CAUD|nr:hypothetical protein UFOVP887_48 [uncultured Caudovirales phage]CAB5226966.1 hypothetical protein UFOVP1516_88 [uncultured Caudovirales phage]